MERCTGQGKAKCSAVLRQTRAANTASKILAWIVRILQLMRMSDKGLSGGRWFRKAVTECRGIPRLWTRGCVLARQGRSDECMLLPKGRLEADQPRFVSYADDWSLDTRCMAEEFRAASTLDHKVKGHVLRPSLEAFASLGGQSEANGGMEQGCQMRQ